MGLMNIKDKRLMVKTSAFSMPGVAGAPQVIFVVNCPGF
jgi:hypothetical protein